MSWIVKCKDQPVWEPALVVGRLFLDELVALERLFGCSSGIRDTGMDSMVIDQAQLDRFMQRGFDVLDRTNSGPLFALVGGCFAIAIALSAKITGSWPTARADLQPFVDRARAVLFPVPRSSIPRNGGPWSVAIPPSDTPG